MAESIAIAFLTPSIGIPYGSSTPCPTTYSCTALFALTHTSIQAERSFAKAFNDSAMSPAAGTGPLGASLKCVYTIAFSRALIRARLRPNMIH